MSRPVPGPGEVADRRCIDLTAGRRPADATVVLPAHVGAGPADPDGSVRIIGLSTVVRGREVLHDVTCTVPAGSVTAVLGPRGAGKTTLLRCVVGMQRPSSGRVAVLGQRPGSVALRRRVGYLTQAPSLYPELTVAENLRYVAVVVGAAPSRIPEVLQQVGAPDIADLPVGRLPAGEHARVSLAAALVGRPELLVLDEPTVGLDPVVRRVVWTLLHGLAGSGTTVLVATSATDEAARCSRLVLLRAGRVLADGSPGRIRASAGTPDLEEAFLRLAEEARDRVEGCLR